MDRKRFRYDTSGMWCKGNTHIHSVVSDGGKNFKELADLYASAGYKFLFRTDHHVVSKVAEDKEQYPLLYLDGVELDGKDETGAAFHVVCLGSISGISGKPEDFVADMQVVRSQALTILAHPYWLGNSFDDYKRWQFDGVEVYNHVCQWLNGKGNGLVYWTEALKNNPEVLAFCADDAHITPTAHPGWNGGWIVVNVKECSAKNIISAIRSGNFYSSCGPEIHSLVLEGDKLHIKTSPVQFVRLVGQDWHGVPVGNFEGRLMTELTMTVPSDWPFVYLDIEDGAGRRAWTNNLFTSKRNIQ